MPHAGGHEQAIVSLGAWVTLPLKRHHAIIMIHRVQRTDQRISPTVIFDELAAVCFECGQVWIVRRERGPNRLHGTEGTGRRNGECVEHAGAGADVELDEGVEGWLLQKLREDRVPKPKIAGRRYRRQRRLRITTRPQLRFIARLGAGPDIEWRNTHVGHYPVIDIA